MRLHYLQHVPFEGLGYIKIWAEENSINISSTRLYKGEQLPSQNEFDFLVVMGGPMSVNDKDIYPWLKNETDFVRETIELDKPVLGICLGAQIIAKSLGAKVYPCHEKEIGWFPVRKSASSTLSKLSEIIPAEFEAFHWHGETFDLPHGSTHLAETSVCKNQAFLYKDNVVGLQFHIEATLKSIAALIDNCSNEIVEASYIQTAEEMLDSNLKIETTKKLMGKILEYLFRKIKL